MSQFLSQFEVILLSAALLFFVSAFIWVWIWAFNPSRKKQLEEYGLIPLKDEEDE